MINNNCHLLAYQLNYLVTYIAKNMGHGRIQRVGGGGGGDCGSGAPLEYHKCFKFLKDHVLGQYVHEVLVNCLVKLAQEKCG